MKTAEISTTYPDLTHPILTHGLLDILLPHVKATAIASLVHDSGWDRSKDNLETQEEKWRWSKTLPQNETRQSWNQIVKYDWQCFLKQEPALVHPWYFLLPTGTQTHLYDMHVHYLQETRNELKNSLDSPNSGYRGHALIPREELAEAKSS